MRSTSENDLWLLMDDEVDPDTDLRRRKMRSPSLRPDVRRAAALTALAEEEELEETLSFTYHASRHEQVWIVSALGGFFQDHVIADVLQLVRGGKEATVYCCRAHPTLGMELLAAKIYRPRMFRNLKNDSIYKDGRAVLDDSGKPLRDHRSQRAIQKKTRIGSEMQITSWIEHEYQTLRLLHGLGARVPRPVAQAGNTILMEYIGEVDNPAPALSNITLSPSEARPLFDLLLHNVRLMLAHDRIHADLSAYNVLYWEGEVTIIDFPQVVDPLYNPQGYKLLSRDVTRLCQYFARYGIRANPDALATDLWGKYLRRELQT